MGQHPDSPERRGGYVLQLNRGRLHARRRPPCALELNPDEAIWDVTKNDRLTNFCPESLDALKVVVGEELRALQASPDRVCAAIRQSELPIHTRDQLV